MASAGTASGVVPAPVDLIVAAWPWRILGNREPVEISEAYLTPPIGPGSTPHRSAVIDSPALSRADAVQ
jgi:hypothetical protein